MDPVPGDTFWPLAGTHMEDLSWGHHADQENEAAMSLSLEGSPSYFKHFRHFHQKEVLPRKVKFCQTL